MLVHAHYPVGETRVQRQVDALVARGYDVDVLCLRRPGEPKQEAVGAVQIHRLPVRRHRSWGMGRQLFEYLAFLVLASARLTGLHRRHRFDTVQVHNLPDALVFAAAGVRRTGTTVILDLHDLLPEFLASRAGVPMDHPLVRIALRLERASCDFADHVITVTEEWRATLAERGVPRSKTSVMMNLADPRIFAPTTVVASPGHNGSLELLYHGTLAHRYGLDVLLRAVAGLRDVAVPVHLTLHGQGDILRDLRVLARDLDLDGAVTFSTDLVATEELPELIRRADIGVVPYRTDALTDGILPTKLLEYVAVGVPVVASATSAVRSYFDDSMVRLVAPGSETALVAAIRALHDEPRLRAELTANARRFEQLHGWDETAEAYVGLVRDLARGRERGASRATSPEAP